MLIIVTLNTAGVYLVQFLDKDFSEMPQINKMLIESVFVDGFHKLHFDVPSGEYTIPYIKIISQTDAYKTAFVKDFKVSCVEAPVPVPVPVAPPVPIYLTPPIAPVNCNCTLVAINPTGMGVEAKWTVGYTDCNGIPQSTSGSGIDSTRWVEVCNIASVSVVGQANITYSVPVAPTPTPTPTPTPSPSPSPTPTPVPATTPVSGSNISIYNYDVTNGNTVNLTLVGGVSGQGILVQLRQGNLVVGSVSSTYATSISLQSSQYGYLDVFINDVDLGSIYIPQQLTGSWTVEKAKAVDETQTLDLQFTKIGDSYIISDNNNNSGWPNVEYWHNSTFLGSVIPNGYSVEPNIVHHITKKRWRNTVWVSYNGDEVNKEKAQLTFKIVSA